MARKKEIDKAIRINVMMDKKTIKELDSLSKKTRMSRSKLLRVASKVLVDLSKDYLVDDKRRDNIVDTLIPFYKKYGWEFDEKKVRSLIDELFIIFKESVVNEAVHKIEGTKVVGLAFLDSDRIITKPEPFTKEDILILQEIVSLEKAKRAKKKSKTKK